MENVITAAASQLASGEAAAGGGDENKAAITNTTLASAAAAAAGTNTPSTIKREQPTAPVQAQQQQNIVTNSIVGTAAGMSGNQSSSGLPQYQLGAQSGLPSAASGSRYQQLMAMIEELGKDIRPTYNGNRNCQERLKRGIIQARLMVRECMGELEKSRQQAAAAGGSGQQ